MAYVANTYTLMESVYYKMLLTVFLIFNNYISLEKKRKDKRWSRMTYHNEQENVKQRNT